MTTEQINTAIALAQGWTRGHKNGWLRPGARDVYEPACPDYCLDLNAIIPLMPVGTRISCSTIGNKPYWCVANIKIVCGRRNLALVASEFLLRTLNLWRD